MIALLLFILPMLRHFYNLWMPDSYRQDYASESFFAYNLSWYIFIVCFVIFSFLRESELARLPSVFDFARFSLSTGEIHPLFFKIKLFGKTADVRTIETILEPGLFLIIGSILWKFDQGIGIFIIVCSIFYSIGYMAAYHQGDNFVMDKIDEMICSEELVSSFVEGKDSSKTRGVHYYGRRPADPDVRRKVADSFFESEDVVEAL
ncbi:hypothetical protein DYBT9275_04894 [Dyadobacter sp. CECT 9275]|uniref:Uncharacterized protein n=1 Tax=Dyadobacter helix TaxID=2822344 RepID=A0A916JIS1_9BACT|nr:hypothetical protein [Dyadobacter sp. CECT 9275]CAG5011155.1 hypothetical protein DYBT9275_04894 [Dyadobacter sp. CECT 9275]